MVRGCGEESYQPHGSQRAEKTGRDQDEIPLELPASPVRLFLSLSPTNNAIKLIIYQWINPLMKAKSSWSNHLS